MCLCATLTRTCAAQLLPSLFVLLAVVAGTLLGSALSTVPFVCFGTYLSWVYLRFLQPNQELNLRCGPRSSPGGLAPAATVWSPTRHLTADCRGDVLNDDFRFATFFPELMHPVVDKLTGALGKDMCFPKAASEAPEGTASVASTLPGSEGADAARRRCELCTVRVLPCACT